MAQYSYFPRLRFRYNGAPVQVSFNEVEFLELFRACVDHGAESAWEEFIHRTNRLVSGTLIDLLRQTPFLTK